MGGSKQIGTFRRALLFLVALLIALAPQARAQEDPDAVLDFANGLFLRTLYREAAREYRRYLDTAGDRAAPEVWYRLGESYFAVWEYEAALEALQTYLKQGPRGGFAEAAAVRVGETYQRMGRPGDAAEAFDRALDSLRDPGAVASALYGLGRARADNRDPQGAIRPLKRLLDEFPDDLRAPFGRFLLARIYQSLDQAEEAALLYETVANAGDPVDPALRHEARYRSGESHARAGDHQRAIAQFEALVGEAPETPFAERAAYGAAWSAHAAGDFDRAIAKARAFTRDYPASELHPAAQYLLGHALQEVSQFAEASAALEALIQDHPESLFADRAAVRLGWVRYFGGDAAGARAAVRRVLARGDGATTGDAQYLLGLVEMGAGNFTDAADAFERASEIEPPGVFAVDAVYKRAETLALIGDTVAAAAAFAAFAQAHPGHPLATQARLRSGDAAFLEADFDTAARQYAAVLAADPDAEAAEEAHYRLAVALHNAGNRAESAAAFEELLAAFPETPHAAEAHLRIGDHYLSEQQPDRAVAAFEALLRVEPESGRAVRGLGLSAYQQGDSANAARHLSAVIADHPSIALDPDTCLWLGQHHFDAGDYASAAAAFQRLLDTTVAYPNLGAIQFKLAESLERAGQQDTALAAYARVGVIEPDTAWALDARYRQGQLLAVRGDTAAAREHFEAAARVLEGEAAARARLEIARMDADAGRPEEAARGFMMVAVLFEDQELTPRALWGAASAYAATGNKAEALACIEELLRDYPDAAHARDAQSLRETLVAATE